MKKVKGMPLINYNNGMIGIFSAAFTSFIATMMIIRYKHLHEKFSLDSDLTGPQKFHKKLVPRIGGISIALGILVAVILKISVGSESRLELLFLICATPTFAIGLIEDLTKNISIRSRLFFTSCGAGIALYLLNIQIDRLDIGPLDQIFAIPGFGLLLTIFAITGLSNAYNIIDGFNGLASMVAIITLLALAYISLSLNDIILVQLSLIMAGAILGFFTWNYPRGLIFLGDGGAYLIGFWIALISILLVCRHNEVSPWLPLLINGYPIVETLFTIYRRKIHQGKSPGEPDGIHFHTLIHRRVLSKKNQINPFIQNAKTAPYLWMLAALSITPSLWWWKSTTILATISLLFIVFYIWIYRRIVYFKTPRWMKI